MWNLQTEDEYEKRVAKWPAKHRRELAATLDNLDTFFKTLRAGGKVEQIRFGFMHGEPLGVIAIDQKGGGVGLKQTRLYIYPHQATQIVHIITIGDKKSQQADIKHSREFVENLPPTTQKD